MLALTGLTVPVWKDRQKRPCRTNIELGLLVVTGKGLAAIYLVLKWPATDRTIS